MESTVVIPWRELIMMATRNMMVQYPSLANKICSFTPSEAGLVVRLASEQDAKEYLRLEE